MESCFQPSLPLPEQKNSGMESRVFGALDYGTSHGALFVVMIYGGPVDISFAKRDPRVGGILWGGYPGEAS